MRGNKVTFSVVSLLACFSFSQALANGTHDEMQAFKFRPVLNAWGYTGNHVIGEAQGLMPFGGDETQLFYADFEGKTGRGNNGWLLGGGLGYRKIYNDRLWGGYVLMDYNKSPCENRFIVVNPGIESLGKVWDFRINGYLPFNHSDWTNDLGTTIIAPESELGIYSNVSFQGHNEYDGIALEKTLIHSEEAVSSGLGVDGEVGRTVPIPIIKNLKAFVGGYYFHTKDFGSVTGASGRLEYQYNSYFGLEFKDTYDNYLHNTAMVGLKVTIGGFNDKEKQQFGLSGRLLDPIEHNLATISEGYAVPIRSEINTTTTIQEISSKQLIHDNIWFHTSGGAIDVEGDGTYEHPFGGFSPETYDQINPDIGSIDKYPLLYFATGSYTFDGFTCARGIADRFDLPIGWGMYGRKVGFIEPAMGDERPVFYGAGLDLNYVANNATAPNVLNSIKLVKTWDFQQSGDYQQSNEMVLYLNSAPNVSLDNVYINNQQSAVDTDLSLIGIDSNNSTLNFINTVGGENKIVVSALVNATTSSVTAEAYGIYSDNSVVNFAPGSATTIEVNASGFGSSYYESTSAESFGIFTYNSEINFAANSTIINSTTNYLGGGLGSPYDAYGIYADNSTVNFTSGTTISAQAFRDSYGIYAFNGSIMNFNAALTTISASTQYGQAYGVKAQNSGTSLNFNAGSTQITASGSYDAFGIYATDKANLSYNSSATAPLLGITVTGGIFSSSFGAVGIFGDTTVTGVTADELNNYNYFTYTKTFGSSGQYKIQWGTGSAIGW